MLFTAGADLKTGKSLNYMKTVQTSTVDNILEHSDPVETVLENDISTSPKKRKALYGSYLDRTPEPSTGENFSYPIIGGAATSAAYTAAGLPGSELVRDYVAWSYSWGEPAGDYFLFAGWAFCVIGGTYLLQAAGKRL